MGLRTLSIGALLGMLASACDSRAPGPSSAQMRLAGRMLAGRIERPNKAYGLVYRLYVPPNSSPARLAPLIVYLHGSGGNGSDNISHLRPGDIGVLLGRGQSGEGAFVLAPQCPSVDKWITQEQRSLHLNYEQSKRPESDAMVLVLALVAELEERFPIDPDRIYLLGASSGAAGTWDVITRHPDHPFAAAVPMTGNSDPSRAHIIATMPIWAFHGAKDLGNPVDNSRAMIAALRNLGSPARYTEYPDLAHNSWDRALTEPGLLPWLFAQRRSHWRGSLKLESNP